MSIGRPRFEPVDIGSRHGGKIHFAAVEFFLVQRLETGLVFLLLEPSALGVSGFDAGDCHDRFPSYSALSPVVVVAAVLHSSWALL